MLSCPNPLASNLKRTDGQSICSFFVTITTIDLAIKIYNETGMKGKKLNIPVIYQTQTEWCWAACAVMILKYYGYNKKFLSAYNQGCKHKDIKKVFSHWKMSCKFKKGKMLFSTIVSEINAGRPIEIGIQIPFGDSHVVIIIGYKTLSESNYVYIIDPKHGGSWHDFKSFFYANGITKWIYTWSNFNPSGFKEGVRTRIT